MQRKILFLLIVSAFSCFSLQAQSPAPTIKKHLRAIAKNERSYLSKETMLAYYNDSEVIKKLEKYTGSKKVKVQTEAIRLTARIGANHQDPDSRSRAVFQLLTTAETATASQVDKIIKGLQKFKATDFAAASKSQLKTLIEAKRPHLDGLVKLAGFLQMEDMLIALQEPYQGNKDLKRNISVALARSGDAGKINNLTRTAQSMTVDDSFVYGVVPLLVYARQKETTDFLFEVIMSDDKTCTPAAPHVPGRIKCGYRVIEMLAPYIENFPVKTGASGDLITGDYRAAMVEVRAWIQSNKDDYRLKTDVY